MGFDAISDSEGFFLKDSLPKNVNNLGFTKTFLKTLSGCTNIKLN